MMKFTYEYCALYYLNWWLRYDSKYCHAFTGKNEAAKQRAAREAASAYRVARNLRKKYDRKRARYQPVLDAIAERMPADFKEPILISSIEKVRDTISEEYGGTDVLSLTTKFLWLRFKRPIIIYDTNSRKTLDTPTGDLTKFYTVWRHEYVKVRSEIDAVCTILPEYHKFCIDPVRATPARIAKWAAQEWFRERVFDIWLWHTGG